MSKIDFSPLIDGQEVIVDGKLWRYNATIEAWFLIRSATAFDQVQTDWNETDTSSPAYLVNKPTLFSGSYNDLTEKPTIPSDINQLDDTNSLLFSRVYDDLTGKPTLFSGSWNDLTDVPDMNSLTADWQANNLDANTLRMRTGAVAGYYVRASDVDGNLEYAAIGASQVYMGTWDASTNTPTLADGTGTQGHWYRVIVGGTIDLGSGSITFDVGDDVSHNGSVWEKIPAKDFTLLPATASQLGGVKIGSNISVTGDGTISVSFAELATEAWVSANFNNYSLESHDNTHHSENYITSAALAGLASESWVSANFNNYSLETHDNTHHSENYLTLATLPDYSIDNLTDVVATDPQDRHGLFYDAVGEGAFVSRAMQFQDLPDIRHADLTEINTNQHIDWTNTTETINTSGLIYGGAFKSKLGNQNYHIFDRQVSTFPTAYFVRNQPGNFISCNPGSVTSWSGARFYVDYNGNVGAQGTISGDTIAASAAVVIAGTPVRSMAYKNVEELSQASYDAIPTKDQNKIYLIPE